SFKADLYGLADLDEAKRYMEHPLLGTRLIEISTALTELDTCDPVAVMGSPDDLKLRSCMTLFSALPNAHPVFSNVLDKFYAGSKDPRTLNILNGIPPFIL
ncbi:MAG: DUF1810 family protein, partial [Clostridia bacterium]|nr:DUF1810 family protein [Clostridia bacterium]